MRPDYKRSFVLIAILIIELVSSSANAVLIGYWKFDESGGDIAHDSSGNSHDGHLSNPKWDVGKINGALSFNKDWYINNMDIPSESLSSINKEVTIAFWQKGDPSLTEITKSCILQGGDNAGVAILLPWEGTVRWYTGNDKIIAPIKAENYKGEWNHWVFTKNASYGEMCIYLNSNLYYKQNNKTNIISVSGINPIRIGSQQTGKWSYYGLIDELAIFDHVLDESEIEGLYLSGCDSNPIYKTLFEAIQKAEVLIKEQKPLEAKTVLEKTIIDYEQLKGKNPNITELSPRIASKLYFLLAKAREEIKASQKDIAEAYCKVFSLILSTRTPEQIPALVWLLENDRNKESTHVIKLLADNYEPNSISTGIIGSVCEYFESKQNLPKFRQFMDILFAQTKQPYQWAIFVESRLSNGKNQWAKEYFSYLASKPRTKFSRDIASAERYVANGEFKKAAELYQDISNRCGSGDDKVGFEFQVCKCLFSAGEYRETVKKLENFIPLNKTTNRSLVKEAIMMEGQSYIQLGEPDNALKSLSIFVGEFPESKESPEVTFCKGYCYMLQNKLQNAIEAFDNVVKNDPNSPYAAKAKMCQLHIGSMAEQK